MRQGQSPASRLRARCGGLRRELSRAPRRQYSAVSAPRASCGGPASRSALTGLDACSATGVGPALRRAESGPQRAALGGRRRLRRKGPSAAGRGGPWTGRREATPAADARPGRDTMSWDCYWHLRPRYSSSSGQRPRPQWAQETHLRSPTEVGTSARDAVERSSHASPSAAGAALRPGYGTTVSACVARRVVSHACFASFRPIGEGRAGAPATTSLSIHRGARGNQQPRCQSQQPPPLAAATRWRYCLRPPGFRP